MSSNNTNARDGISSRNSQQPQQRQPILEQQQQQQPFPSVPSSASSSYQQSSHFQGRERFNSTTSLNSFTGFNTGSPTSSSYFSTSSASRYVPNTNEPSSVSSSYKSAVPQSASYHTAFSPYNTSATPHITSSSFATSTNTFQDRFGGQSLHKQNEWNPNRSLSVSSTNTSPSMLHPERSPQSDPPLPEKSRIPSISEMSFHSNVQSNISTTAKQPTIRTSLLTSKLAAAAAAAATTPTTANTTTTTPINTTSNNTNTINASSDAFTNNANFPSPTSKINSNFGFAGIKGSAAEIHASPNTSSSAFPYPNPRSGSIRKHSPRSTTGAGAFGTSPYSSGISSSFGTSSRHHNRLSTSFHRHGSLTNSQSFLPHPASTTTNVTMAIASGTSTPHSQNSDESHSTEVTGESSQIQFNSNFMDKSSQNDFPPPYTSNDDSKMDVDEKMHEVEAENNTNLNENLVEKNDQKDNFSSDRITTEQDENLNAEGGEDSHMSSTTPMQNASSSSYFDQSENETQNEGELNEAENPDTVTDSTSNTPPKFESDSQGNASSASSESTSNTSSSSNSAQDAKTFEHLDIATHPVSEVIVMLTALLQKIIDANDSLHPNHYQSAAAYSSASSAHPLANGTNNPTRNQFTANVLAFHGRNVPAIGLEPYLNRILKYCPTTNEVFISLLVYFDRIAQRANSGELSNDNTDGETDIPNNESQRTPSDNSATPPQTPPTNAADVDNANQSSNQTSNTSSSAMVPKKQLFVMDSYNIHRLIIAGVTVASKFFSDVFYKNSRYAKVGGLPIDELNHLELQFLLLTDFRLMIPLEELQRYADLLLGFWKKEQSTATTSTDSNDTNK